MAEEFGRGARAATGLADVLVAVHEQRVEALLVDDGHQAPGVCCPQCGFLGATASECPADGTPMDARENIVEVVIQRAITQSADVHVLRGRPELAAHGHIAALLRF